MDDKENNDKIFECIDQITDLLRQHKPSHALSAIFYVLYQSHKHNDVSKKHLINEISNAWDYYEKNDI